MEIKDVDMAQKIHALRTELAAARMAQKIHALRTELAAARAENKAMREILVAPCGCQFKECRYYYFNGMQYDNKEEALAALDAALKAKGGGT